jgi:aryl-alcohol dehydrogenase-like predicted oxidoreductase
MSDEPRHDLAERELSRRDFLRTSLAAGAVASTATLSLGAERRTATDWVTLGKSDVKVTRLAYGTGSMGGDVQRSLGQQEFTRQVRYAYDHGIRFFETAESYGETQQMLGVALKGLPRESYRIMSKVTTSHVAGQNSKADAHARLDQLRRNVDTDYFDIMLLHWQHTPSWPSDSAHWQDAILAAQEKKTVLSHGASVHGLPALRQVPGNQWLELAMIRMNHNGTRMDTEVADGPGRGDVSEVVQHVRQVKKEGMGVISMKLAGEGAFNREDRQKAMRFAFNTAGVDAVTVGYKSTAEIDEAIENLNLALA